MTSKKKGEGDVSRNFLSDPQKLKLWDWLRTKAIAKRIRSGEMSAAQVSEAAHEALGLEVGERAMSRHISTVGLRGDAE